MSRRKHISLEDFNEQLNSTQPMPAAGIVNHVLNDTGPLDDCVDFDNFNSNVPTASELFDDVVSGEMPDVSDDIELLVQVDASLESLSDLMQDIRQAGGMSVDIALECQRIIPEFGIPLNRFTKHPTKTQYKASMESIMDTIIAAAVKAFKYVRNAILRAFYWIIGVEYKPENPHTSGNASLDEIEEIPQDVINKVKEKLQDYASSVKEANGALKSIEFQVRNFEAIAANAGIEYRDAKNNLEWYRDPGKFITDMDYANGNETEKKIYEFVTSGDRIHNDLKSSGQYIVLFTKVDALLDEAIAHSKDIISKYQNAEPDAFESLTNRGGIIAEKAKDIEHDAMNRDYVKSSASAKKLSELMVPYERLNDLIGAGFAKSTEVVNQLETFNFIVKSLRNLHWGAADQGASDVDGVEAKRIQVKHANAVARDSLVLVKAIGAFLRLIAEVGRSGRNFANTMSYLVNKIANNSIPGKGEKSIDELKRLQETSKIVRQELTTYAIKIATIMNA